MNRREQEETLRHEWEGLLQWWNAYLFDEDYKETLVDEELPPAIVASRWLGYLGATEEQIFAAERRLSTTLPLSYRAFLRVTNGWRVTTLGRGGRLLPIEEVDWFVNKSRPLLDNCLARTRNPQAYRLILVHGVPENSWPIPQIEHLETALQVSDLVFRDTYDYETGTHIDQYYTSVYLLNPKVLTETGEWEAWELTNPDVSSRIPGAFRFPSFIDLLDHEWQDYRALH
jgi:hypothetical protein